MQNRRNIWSEEKNNFCVAADWLVRQACFRHQVELRNVPSWKMTFSCFSSISLSFATWSACESAAITSQSRDTSRNLTRLNSSEKREEKYSGRKLSAAIRQPWQFACWRRLLRGALEWPLSAQCYQLSCEAGSEIAVRQWNRSSRSGLPAFSTSPDRVPISLHQINRTKQKDR